MTLQAISPEMIGFQDNSWTNTNGEAFIIDASGEKAAAIFRVPKTGTIDGLTFRVGALTTAQTLRVGLETIDASGDPTGTQYGGSAVGLQASPVGNTTYEVTLATAASAVVDDHVAMVVQFDGTIGNLRIQGMGRQLGRGFPYSNHFTTAWAHHATILLVLGVRYNDGSYAMVHYPPGGVSTVTYNSSSSSDELANVFIPPFKCALGGIWVFCDLDNAADIVLYDTNGTTALKTISLSSAARGSTLHGLSEVTFADVVLTAGGSYRLALKPTSTGNIIANRLTVLTAAAMDGLPLGQKLYESSRADAGTWTDTLTQRLAIGPIITQLDDGAGGGGSGGGPLVGGRLVGS